MGVSGLVSSLDLNASVATVFLDMQEACNMVIMSLLDAFASNLAVGSGVADLLFICLGKLHLYNAYMSGSEEMRLLFEKGTTPPTTLPFGASSYSEGQEDFSWGTGTGTGTRKTATGRYGQKIAFCEVLPRERYF